MELKEYRQGATLVLLPEGRLDARSAAGFEERLLGLIAAGERSILLDFARLDYISSTGLRTLLTATKRLNEGDGRLLLCGLTANVRDVFRVSGFDTILEIHPDAATALAALA
jgi:anti-anti-sigma factor